MFSRQVKI